MTITGTDFTGATSVLFGSAPATRFTVVNSTTITAVSPPESAGVSDVTVTTPSGTSRLSAGDRFTSEPVIVPSPVVTSVSPASGPTTGGTTVAIRGTGFTEATKVEFGSTAAHFAVKSSTSIVATSPARVAGISDVRVATPGGTSSVVTADRFTSVAAAKADRFTYVKKR